MSKLKVLCWVGGALACALPLSGYENYYMQKSGAWFATGDGYIWDHADDAIPQDANADAFLPPGVTLTIDAASQPDGLTLHDIRGDVLDKSKDGTNVGYVVIPGGTINCSRFYMGYKAGTVHHVTHTGGAVLNLTLGAGNLTFDLGRGQTNGTDNVETLWTTYDLQDGLVSCATDGNVGIGSDRGFARLTVGAKGKITGGVRYWLGHNDNSCGQVLIDGGVLEQTWENGCLYVGERDSASCGISALTVQNGGLVDCVTQIGVGRGDVTVADGTLKANALVGRGATTYQGSLTLDGAEIVMQGATRTRADFVSLDGAVYLGDGGASFTIPAASDATIVNAIVVASGAAGTGAFVKKGAGTLRLLNALGGTGTVEVREGALYLDRPGLVAAERLSVTEGAVVSLNTENWSEAEAAAFRAAAGLQALGALSVTVPAGETRVLEEAIGNGYSDVEKFGPGTLVLKGANAFTGDLKIFEGTVQADVGTGLPATAGVKLLGGRLAPLAVETITLPLGTGTGAIDAANGPLGFSSEAGAATVNLGGAAEPIVLGSELFPSGQALFNSPGALGTLDFLNPFALGTQDFALAVESAAPEAVVTLAGGVSAPEESTGRFTKTGAGTLRFDDRGALAITGHDANLFAGATVFDGGAHATGTLLVQDSTVVFTNTTLAVTGQFLMGNRAADDVVNVYAYESDISTTAWIAMGRYNKATCNYTMTGGRLSGGGDNVLLIGNKATGTFTQNGGTVELPKAAIAIGEYDNDDGLVGTGSYTLNGGSIVTRDNAWALSVGHYGDGTFNQVDGDIELKNTLYVGNNSKAVGRYRLTSGTIVQNKGGEFYVGRVGKGTLAIDGGSITSTRQVSFGHEAGSQGSLEMTDGVFTGGANFMVGRYGIGTIEMSGGELSRTGGEFSLARWAAGTGTVHITGGALRYGPSTTQVKAIGWEGFGILNVGGTGLFSMSNTVTLASGAAATGEINLSENGVFEAKNVKSGAGYKKITADGGTFRVLGDAQEVTYFGALDESYVGPGGVTFDVGSNNATLTDFATDGHSVGPIRKTGAGTLTLAKLPNLYNGFDIQEGTLALAQGATVGPDFSPALEGEADNVYPESPSEQLLKDDYLLHRWSFTNASLADTVGGTMATLYDDATNVTFPDNQVNLPGGSRGKRYIDLGSGLFGSADSSFTIELFVTMTDANAGKLFSVGNNGNSEIFVNINGGVCARGTGGNYQGDKLGKGADGDRNHYSVVLTPNGDGTYQVVIRRKDATGATVGSYTYTQNAYSPIKYQDRFLLGYGWHNEDDAKMRYDEVRIWNAALSDAQLTANVLMGPDKIPALTVEAGLYPRKNGALTLADGATFDLGGNVVSYASLGGAGTVANGVLEVTEDLHPAGTLHLATSVKPTGTVTFGEGDAIVTTGRLDLTQATLVYDGPAVGAVTLATAVDGGEIVGPVAKSVIAQGGKNCLVKVTSGFVRVVRAGMTLLIR